MNFIKKLFKNKKGSGLVEKIMMVAFSVAAGGAVIIYTSNVIIEAKSQQTPGLNLVEGDVNSQGNQGSRYQSVQLLKNKAYRVTYRTGDSVLDEIEEKYPGWCIYLTNSVMDKNTVTLISGTKTSDILTGDNAYCIYLGANCAGTNREGSGGLVYKYSGTFIATFTLTNDYSRTTFHETEVLQEYGSYFFEEL